MRLLLTVVRASELGTALGAGPDLLDLKDPSRGSLGPPPSALVRQAARRLAGSSPGLSVPLGDGPHGPGAVGAAAGRAARSGADYVKVGLLGHARREEAVEVLGRARVGIDGSGHPGAELVAVSFADARNGRAPPPGGLVEAAVRGGADRVMLDTLDKGAGPVTDLLGRGRLGRWLAAARGRGLGTALAGGLGPGEVRGLAGLGVEVVGVRGGACADGVRSARLDPGRARELAEAVRAVNRREAAPRGA